MKNRNTSKRGFTLTELAIFLGFAGILLGAVFAASVGVWSNTKLDMATSEVWEISRNMRTLYTGLPITANPSYKTLVEDAKVFPEAMVRGAVGSKKAYNVWGGEVDLEPDFAAKPKTFLIRFNGVPERDCTKFLLLIPPTGQDGSPVDSFIVTSGGADDGTSLVGKGPGEIASRIATAGVGCSGAVFEFAL